MENLLRPDLINERSINNPELEEEVEPSIRSIFSSTVDTIEEYHVYPINVNMGTEQISINVRIFRTHQPAWFLHCDVPFLIVFERTSYQKAIKERQPEWEKLILNGKETYLMPLIGGADVTRGKVPDIVIYLIHMFKSDITFPGVPPMRSLGTEFRPSISRRPLNAPTSPPPERGPRFSVNSTTPTVPELVSRRVKPPGPKTPDTPKTPEVIDLRSGLLYPPASRLSNVERGDTLSDMPQFNKQKKNPDPRRQIKEEIKKGREAAKQRLIVNQKDFTEIKASLDKSALTIMQKAFLDYISTIENMLYVPPRMIDVLQRLPATEDEELSSILLPIFKDKIDFIKENLKLLVASKLASPAEKSEFSTNLEDITEFNSPDPDPVLFLRISALIKKYPRRGGKKSKRKRKTRRKRSVRFHR
jgi:hypothetical protein